MKHQLYEKSQTTEPYSQKELGWLLDHVGDSDASIRDDLVYASFCHALLDGLVKTVDFVWLADQVIKRNLLFYKIEEVGQTTLTRSGFIRCLAHRSGRGRNFPLSSDSSRKSPDNSLSVSFGISTARN